MHIFHKWKPITESPKWLAEQCEKCGKIRWIEKFSGGYEPRPPLPDHKIPVPPRMLK